MRRSAKTTCLVFVRICCSATLKAILDRIGPCPKRVHDEALRETFELEGERWRESFELALFSTLHRIIGDLQKKIRKAQARLETKASEEVEQLLNPERDDMQERKATLEVQMKILISQLEEYAEKGLMKEVQELNVRARCFTRREPTSSSCGRIESSSKARGENGGL